MKVLAPHRILPLGAALLAAPPLALAQTNPPGAAASAAAQALSIKPPQTGREAAEPEGNEFFPGFSLFAGRLVYAWDNARYSGSGFSWPWQNYLVERLHGKDATASRAQSHQVDIPNSAFVYEPKYLPDSQSFLFKAGDPTNSSGLYDLYWYKPSLRQLQVVAKNLSYRLVWPSPGGRFVAYIAGAWPIPLRGGMTPAELHVFDLKTSTDFVIRSQTGEAKPPRKEREPLLETIAWLSEGRLLFNLEPPPAKPVTPADAPAKPWFSDIYQADLTQASTEPQARPRLGQPKYLAPSLWLLNGYRPLPSPDGEWLALLRDETPAPNPPEPAQASPNAASGAPKPPVPRAINLILLNTRSNSRVLVEAAKRSTNQMMWSSSKRLLLLSKQFKGAVGSGAGRKALMQMAVSEYDLETRKQRRVGAADYVAPPGSDIRDDNPLLRPVSVSRDGKWLFLEMLQFEEAPNNGLLLKAMGLEDGRVLPLCRLISVRRLDWLGTTAPAQGK